MKKLLIALMMLPLCMAAQTKMTRYLFAYFNNNTTEGQQVCYAVSNDGVNFTPLNDGLPVIASDTISRSGGVRDPHIVPTRNEGYDVMSLGAMIYAN
jgi:sucrose-6-phosphate hydrolase SacC (GH32 family)